MKKSILLIPLITLFLITPVLAIECSKNIDCDDNLKYTKDLCENAGTEESYCLNEATSPQFSLLSQILDVLKQILLKDWTINVEPTPITVEPNITINPEIVIPEKDCEWEKVNQLIITNDVAGGGTFALPNNIEYSKIVIKKFGVYYQCFIGACYFHINNNHCFTIASGESKFIDLTTNSCFLELNEGVNDYQTYGGNGKVKQTYVEMEVKPANC